MTKRPKFLSNISNSGEHATFSSREIKKALKSLEDSLGMTVTDALFNDLGMYGLPLVNDHVVYTLEEVQAAFAKLFGTEASEVLIERLKTVLEK